MCWTASLTHHRWLRRCTSTASYFGRASLVVYVVFWTFMPTSLVIWRHFKTPSGTSFLQRASVESNYSVAHGICRTCANTFLCYFSACDYLCNWNEFLWHVLMRNNNWLRCNFQRIEAQLHLWTWQMCYCEQRSKTFSCVSRKKALLTLNLSHAEKSLPPVWSPFSWAAGQSENSLNQGSTIRHALWKPSW